MSDFPQGWAEVEFSELNSFRSKTIDPSAYPEEIFELYSVPIFPTGNPELLTGLEIGSTKQIVGAGDVLVCKINPRINRVWIVGKASGKRQIASSEWIVMRANQHDSRFLKHYFASASFRELLCTDLTGVGGSLTRAQPRRVATYKIPVAPLAEQKRIADKLDTLLARVDATHARLDHIVPILKRFRQSVLAAATSGKLTEDWRQEQSAKASVVSVDPVHHGGDIEQLPHEGKVKTDSIASHLQSNLHSELWPITTVDAVSRIVFDGPFGSNLKSDDYSEFGFRVVRLENIGWMNFVFEKKTFISNEKFEKLKKHTLLADDILFSSFVAEEVRVCMLPPSLNKVAINKADCFCIRVNEDICDPHFLLIRLACYSTYKAFEESVHGATRPRINLGQLRRFQFRLPEIKEQKEIVRRVGSLFALADKIEERYTSARTQVDKLTPALLAKAFRGELVAQDPNDEPAEQLLIRLHAMQDASLSAPTRGRKTAR